MFKGPLRARNEEEKCSYLLLWVGEKGRDVYHTWTLTADDAKKLKTYYTISILSTLLPKQILSMQDTYSMRNGKG